MKTRTLVIGVALVAGYVVLSRYLAGRTTGAGTLPTNSEGRLTSRHDLFNY